MTSASDHASLAPLVKVKLAGAGLAVALGLLSASLAGAAEGSAAEGSAADSVVAARSLGYEGIAAYQAGDHVAASQKLNRAYQLLPVPSLGLWSARALTKLNLLVEAARRYDEVSRSTSLAGDADVQRQAKAEATRELSELLPRIPSVSLQLQAANWDEVAVSIDGLEITAVARRAPILVNPGERLIEAQRGQRHLALRHIAVAQQQGTVVLDFSEPHGAVAQTGIPSALGLGLDGARGAGTALDSGPDATWRTVGWVAVGVGGSALLLSGVAGLVAWNQLEDFDCKHDPCTSPDADAVDTYNSLVRASTVGYIVGGVVAGAGALLLYRYPASERVTLGVGAGSVALSGRF